MRFHHLTIATGSLLGALVLNWPAMAAENTATLRKALSHIPEGAIATQDPMPIAFIDVKAMSRTENGALSDTALRRFSFARFLRPFDVLEFGMGKSWTEKAGIPFEDISYFVGNGMPPVRLTYWGLADAEATTTLLDALGSRKFKEVQASPRMLANGEPRGMNFQAPDAENPWLGMMGQTSYVVALDDAVVQGTAPEDLKPVLEMTRSVADNAAYATILDGLARAPVSKDASLLQALLVTPLFGLSAVDTSDLLLDNSTDMEAMKKKLEAKIAEGAKGIPPYLGGIIVDAQTPKGPAFLISLAYGDCANADIAVSTMQARWKEAMDIGTILEMAGQSVPSDNGCAAVVSFTAKTNINQPLLDAYGAALDRKFNILQIGKSD